MLKQITIYCDGCCYKNPGPGGYGAILIYNDIEKEIYGSSDGDTTNNRMEITAAIKALQALKYKCKVNVFTDSQYVVNTMNGKFKKSKNKDLWDILDEEVAKHEVSFLWIKGHSGNRYNERVDTLAKLGGHNIKYE